MEKNPIETNKSVKNILQDPSTVDLLLMDPPLPYPPIIAPAPMAPSQGSPLSSCPPASSGPSKGERVGRDPWNWEGPWGPRTKGPLHLIQQWPSPSEPMGS